MTLFNVVRDINKEIDECLNERSNTDTSHKLVTGVTDGTQTVIKFSEFIVWDSEKWQEKPCPPLKNSDVHDADELDRIERSVRASINSHLEQMFTIRVKY